MINFSFTKEDIDKYFTSVLKVINVVSTMFLKEYFNKRNIVVANYYFNNAATENSDCLDDKSKLQQDSPVETQLYWVSSRYYSPELCRWISPDSIEYLDPESINGLNLYAYCGNDPVNKYDPTGHFGIWAIIGIVGAAILIGGAQLASNALAGETGSDLWRGVAGAALGSGVNALALCLSPFTGGASLAFAAGLGAAVQTGVDTLETVIRGETVNGWQTVADLGINFITTFAGNWIGSKLIPTNSGWFEPKKFLSVFMKPYGQKILLQTAIGAGL